MSIALVEHTGPWTPDDVEALPDLGVTRTSKDFVAHLANIVGQLPNMPRYDWVVDNLKTHWAWRCVTSWRSVAICLLPPKARRRGVERRAFLGDVTHIHVCHFISNYGSWLHQVE